MKELEQRNEELGEKMKQQYEGKFEVKKKTKGPTLVQIATFWSLQIYYMLLVKIALQITINNFLEW